MGLSNTLKNYEQGILYILLSAFCLSIFGLFAKLGIQKDAMPLLLFLRFFLPFFILFLFFLFRGMLRKIFPLKNSKNQFFRALSVLVGQYSLFYYLTKGTLFDATMLANIGPIFIPIFSKFFYRHQVEKKTWLSLGIALLGVALILKPSQGIFDLFSVYGLIAGLGMAVSQVLYAANIEKESSAENLFYLYLFTTLLSTIPLVFELSFQEAKFLDWERIFILEGWAKNAIYLFMLSVATIGNQFYRGLAYRQAKPATLAPFLYVTVLFSGIFDWTIFHNIPDFYSFLGAALIASSFFVQWSLKKS